MRHYTLRIRGAADGHSFLSADAGSVSLTGSDATLTYTQSAVEPDILEDFSTYADTADMLSDPREVYIEAECFDQVNNTAGAGGVVALDAGVGHGDSDRSLRFDWDVAGAPETGATISRAIRLPDATTEVWLEVQHRFSASFEMDNGLGGGVGYKFIFINQNGGGAGRFAFEWTNDPGVLNLYPPDADWGPSEEYHLDLSPGIEAYLDDAFHRYRMHVRLGASPILAGQVDDGDVVMAGEGFSTSATELWNVALGKNINQQPVQAQSNWWGRAQVWLDGNDPGWGW